MGLQKIKWWLSLALQIFYITTYKLDKKNIGLFLTHSMIISNFLRLYEIILKYINISKQLFSKDGSILSLKWWGREFGVSVLENWFKELLKTGLEDF